MKRTTFITLFLIIFAFITLSATAQVEENFRIPDSLLMTLDQNTQQDFNRVEALASIIDYCNMNRQYQKAEPYISEIIKISDKLDDNYVKALSSFYNGTLLLNLNEYNDAVVYLNKGLNIVSFLPENENSNRLHARLLNSLGALYNDKKMFSEGYDYLSKGLEICKKLNDGFLTKMLGINMANLYSQTGRYVDAISLCKKILSNNDGTVSKHIAYSIIAESFRCKKCVDSGLMYFDSAFLTSASRFDESRCLSDKAMLYYENGQFDEATRILKYVLGNYRKDLYKDVEIIALDLYGYLIGLNSQTDRAISYIDSAIYKSEENGMLMFEMECYASKYKLQYRYDDYEGFSKTILKYVALRDSLDIIDDQQRLEKAWLANEFKKTEEQLKLEKELSDIKNQRSKMRLWLIIFGLASISVIFILAYNRRNILVKNKDMELKNKDMELKTKELKEEVLTKEIESRNRELTAKALVQVQRQELLTDMIEKLKTIADDKRKLPQNLNEVIANFEKYKSSTTPEDFDYYFTQTNPDFYKHLIADFPNLTPYEQRLCAFVRLNLNTKDIAAILNISPDSAKVARARLRKSLNLVGTDEDLTVFLSKY